MLVRQRCPWGCAFLSVASIRSLALVLRSQKSFVIPLSKGTGMHFYLGKWQGLKFPLKEVSDLLKVVLRLKKFSLPCQGSALCKLLIPGKPQDWTWQICQRPHIRDQGSATALPGEEQWHKMGISQHKSQPRPVVGRKERCTASTEQFRQPPALVPGQSVYLVHPHKSVDESSPGQS